MMKLSGQTITATASFRLFFDWLIVKAVGWLAKEMKKFSITSLEALT